MQKVLLGFGFIWVLIWCGYGLYMGGQNTEHLMKMYQIASTGNLAEFHGTSVPWNYRSYIHAHCIFYALLAIFAALTFPYLGFGRVFRRLITILYITGCIVFVPLLKIYIGPVSITLHVISSLAIIGATGLVVIGLFSSSEKS